MLEVVVFSLSLFAFALVSRRVEGSVITAPMIFTGVGLILGATGLGVLDVEIETEAATILIEATLVVVLFSDAARIDLRALTAHTAIPVRLLAIGLPLTLLAGTALAWWLIEGLSLVEAALLAALLTPTDAALGQAVVSDERLPARVRQSLNVESGLNDGIMVPVVTVLLALAVVAEPGVEGDQAGIGFAAAQIGFGVLAGVLAGGVGGWTLQAMHRRGFVEGAWRQIATLSIAATSYAGSEVVGGNGFVAAFVAGLAFDRAVGEMGRDASDLSLDLGDLLSAVTFFLFGAVLAGPLLGDLTTTIVLYAVLSLTLVRLLPTLVAMIGSGTRIETRLFLGWFGPRGLASILFAVLVAEELSGPEADLIVTVATWTILLSVFAHGLTAGPWATRLARVLGSSGSTTEIGPAMELPTRRSPR